MALKAGYYGVKKGLLNKLQKLTGIYSLDSETLELSSAGELKVIGGSGGTTVEGNPQDEATDTLSKIKIGTNVYDVPDTTYSEGTGIDVSGQNVISLDADINDLDDVNITNPQDGQILQYDATSQKWVNHINAPEYISITVDIYSAASDTVTFTDRTGVKTVTTDTSGHGIASIICINGDSITFTSSVAKNPSNLSQAYSKTVTIGANTTEVYIMPDNVCYWWGYKSSEYQVVSTSNGWVNSGDAFEVPTENTNYVALTARTGGGYDFRCAFVYKDKQTANKAYAITQGITIGSGRYASINALSGKTYATSILGTANNANQPLSKFELDCSSYGQAYIAIQTVNGGSVNVYALWHD